MMLHAVLKRSGLTRTKRPRATRTHAVAGDPESVERILRAAEDAFREHGYAGVSLRRIADRAGVSKSLVLYHFEAKERIFAELQLRVYRRLARILTEAAGPGTTPTDRASRALDALEASVRNGNDVAVHAMLATRALWDPSVAPHVRRMRQELHRLLRATMRSIFAQEAERLRVPLDTTADVLWAALTGLGMDAAIDASPDELERGFAALRLFAALAFETRDGDARSEVRSVRS